MLGRKIKIDTRLEMLKNKKRAARKMANRAVRLGKILSSSCEWPPECLIKPVEGHHEDYDKPLELLWLCRQHHLALHSEGNWGKHQTYVYRDKNTWI